MPVPPTRGRLRWTDVATALRNRLEGALGAPDTRHQPRAATACLTALTGHWHRSAPNLHSRSPGGRAHRHHATGLSPSATA